MAAAAWGAGPLAAAARPRYNHPMRIPVCLLAFVCLLPGLSFSLETRPGPAYRQLNSAAAAPGAAGTDEAAASGAARTFDEPIDHSMFAEPSAPAAAAPVPTLQPANDFVVGSPRWMSEPENPLPKGPEGKKSDSGGMKFGMRLLGAVLGGLLCGGLGFFLAGPLGAAIGFAGGALGGWFATGS